MVRGSQHRAWRVVPLVGLPVVVVGDWAPLAGPEVPAQPQSLGRSGIGGLAEPGSVGSQLLKTAVSRNHVLVASVFMGSPPQELRCLLDTGSSDLWVPSRRCDHCGSTGSFDAKRSSTFLPAMVETPEGRKPRLVKMTYGTGQIMGVAARDTLSFGSWHISNQSFIIVEDAALPHHLSWDGICGLAWDNLAVAGRPLYRRLREEGHPALFSLVPGRLGSGPHLVLGELPTKAMEPGTLAWAPAERLQAAAGEAATGGVPLAQGGAGAGRSFWVTSGGVAAGGEEVKQVRFLVDTGTNQVLLVPPREFEAFLRALLPLETLQRQCGVDKVAGGLFLCECSVRERALPPLKVLLGGRTFALPMFEMFRRIPAKDGGEDLCLLEVQPNRMASPGFPASLKDLIDGLFKPELLGHGCCSWDDMHCGHTTPYCRSSQAHCEEHCKGKWKFMDALPFAMPPGAEGVEEVVEVRPDSSVCRTWKVTDTNGQVIKQETRCVPPGRSPAPAAARRRLQLAPGLPPQGVRGEAAAELRSLLDEIWVLGGIFLERFVTVLDFDEGRMGFAEPLHLPTKISMAQTGLSAMDHAAGGSLSGHAPVGLAVALLFAVALLAAGLVLVLRSESRARQIRMAVSASASESEAAE